MNKIKYVLSILAVLTLVSCAKDEPTRLTDVTGLIPDLDFTLIDENNKTATANDFLGYSVALFFGFTNCPEICPTTMHQLSSVLKKVDPNGAAIKVLFVSVDPERDSTEKLKKYTNMFGPAFIGLRGEEPVIKAMTKKYRVTFGYGDKDGEGNYDVSHSGAVFIFDAKGKARLLATQSSTNEDILYDLENLVKR